MISTIVWLSFQTQTHEMRDEDLQQVIKSRRRRIRGVLRIEQASLGIHETFAFKSWRTGIVARSFAVELFDSSFRFDDAWCYGLTESVGYQYRYRKVNATAYGVTEPTEYGDAKGRRTARLIPRAL